MAISLGAIVFDEAHTDVKESLEEVGGRNEREVVITGLIVGEESVADIHDRLDAILDEASKEDFSVPLSIRVGRQAFVRRNGFRREVRGDALVGSFVLELVARDPLEESVASIAEFWNVAGSGASRTFTPGGNVDSFPIISLTPSSDVTNPSFFDGVRTFKYLGVISSGETYIIDGNKGIATLEGVDVLGYTRGEFPQLAPEGTELTYFDDLVSPVAIAVSVIHAGRWW